MKCVFAIGLLLIVTGGCGRHIFHSPALETALVQAGANRAELESVLDHYRDRDDELKLRAARFLIENMEGHSYVTFALYDSAGAEVDLDVLAHPDYDALIAAVDSIEAQRGELDYERRLIRPDLATMTADLLIENIDLAFRAWREMPWARHLSFEDFCAYVLPYRGSNEPLESWRGHFLQRYADLPTNLEDPTDPIAAARAINQDLKSWFGFDPRFYLHPTDQGLCEMRSTRLGRCEDMTNITIYAMRAMGLAVTSDYTPFWANAGNNHAWNAILDKDGRAVIFMGCEADPGQYRLHNRLAKAYRKTYAQQPDNLVFRVPEGEKVPPWLRGKNYIDVTPDYQEVRDVVLAVDPPPPDSIHFAYLCVFNSGNWEAVHWGQIVGRSVTFTDMGLEIAYLPAYYMDDEFVPLGPAFVLEADGTIRPLTADPARPIMLQLRASTRSETVSDTDGIRKVELAPGMSYELHYWRDEWVALGRAVAGTDPIEFSAVPSGGLYWMVAEESRKDERIFTYEEDRQIWW